MNQRSILVIYNRKGAERDRMDYTNYQPYAYSSRYSWQNGQSYMPQSLESVAAMEPEQALPQQESIHSLKVQ